MRSSLLRFGGAWFFILALSTVAAYPQSGLSPGSWEETTTLDLDGDGIPQDLEFRLARHFFPTIWYDQGENTSSPGGNHNHRVSNQPGRLLFRVRPHPQSPRHIAISYALLYRMDGGETAALACHGGDVEPFAITLKPDPSCALGYSMEAIKTWAHEGAYGQKRSEKYASGCNWGFSNAEVSHSDVVLASENKHGNFLSEDVCDSNLAFNAENCDYDWTAADINAWRGLNVGEWSAQRHDDLWPLGFIDRLWSSQRFCGGPHTSADLDRCGGQLGECTSAPHTKFTDHFVAPFIPLPPPPPPSPPNYAGCFTDNDNRALPYGLGNVNDIDTCVNLARANGLAYAGLQWYGQCWGGNELRYTQVGEEECQYAVPERADLRRGLAQQHLCDRHRAAAAATGRHAERLGRSRMLGLDLLVPGLPARPGLLLYPLRPKRRRYLRVERERRLLRGVCQRRLLCAGRFSRMVGGGILRPAIPLSPCRHSRLLRFPVSRSGWPLSRGRRFLRRGGLALGCLAHSS